MLEMSHDQRPEVTGRSRRGQAWTMFQGDSLELLGNLAPGSVDALITDAPYSSGGMVRGDRACGAQDKYLPRGSRRDYSDFMGDNRDQRSWTTWCSLWVSRSLRAVKPGGYLLLFTDWRQLPATTDALQAGGGVWRGIVAWDKTEGSRAPHPGYFRHQAEYVVWGTRGSLPVPDLSQSDRGPWRGVMRYSVGRKLHPTGKPVELMRELVRVAPPGGVILDPFAGSGSTGVAAVSSGRRFLGIEASIDYFGIASDRLAELDPEIP